MGRFKTKKRRNKKVEVDPYKRYQNSLKVSDLFPLRDDGLCACGCKKKLTGRQRRWASKTCNNKAVEYFFIIKGSIKHIRKALQKKEKGKCQDCGEIKKLPSEWQADHILEVRDGGGGKGIENYQTLCIVCHKKKTKSTTQRIVEERKKGKK